MPAGSQKLAQTCGPRDCMKFGSARLLGAAAGLKEAELVWVAKCKDKEMRPVGMALVCTKQFVVAKGSETVQK